MRLFLFCRSLQKYKTCLKPLELSCPDGVTKVLEYGQDLRKYLLKMNFICRDDVFNGQLTEYEGGMWNCLINRFIQAISIAPLQVRYYSEALPTQRGYCAGVSRRSATAS